MKSNYKIIKTNFMALFSLTVIAMISSPVSAAQKCSAKQQVEKCASQCRFCTEGNHGSACFAGWWNAWLKPDYKKSRWMLTDGSYSRGHKTSLLSDALQAIASKKGVEVSNLKNDDVMAYANNLTGKALGTIASSLDKLGLATNEMKIQCYNFCDFNPDTYRKPSDYGQRRAGIQLDDGACKTGGPGSWKSGWLTDALKNP